MNEKIESYEEIKILGKYSNRLFIWSIVALIAGIISAIVAVFTFLSLMVENLALFAIITGLGLILIVLVAWIAIIVTIVYRFLLGKVNINFSYSAILLIAMIATVAIYYTVLVIMTIKSGVKQFPIAILAIMIIGLLSTYFFMRGYREATISINSNLSKGWNIVWILSIVGYISSIIGYILVLIPSSVATGMGIVINVLGCMTAFVAGIIQLVYLKKTAIECNNIQI